jgi:hypothetical protein
LRGIVFGRSAFPGNYGSPRPVLTTKHIARSEPNRLYGLAPDLCHPAAAEINSEMEHDTCGVSGASRSGYLPAALGWPGLSRTTTVKTLFELIISQSRLI